MAKRMLFIALSAVMVMLSSTEAYARKVAYRSYGYDNMPNIHAVPSRTAYVPVATIDGDGLGVGTFVAASDIHVAPYLDPETGETVDDVIYLSDTGNNRIVIFDRNGNLMRVVNEFNNNGLIDTFNAPDSICVPKGMERIYIADTLNKRIIIFDMYFNVIDTIEEPTGDAFRANFIFYPMKVTVDTNGRVYVRVRNEVEGLLSFNPDGTFGGYFGSILVSASATDIFWRMVSSKTQNRHQKQFIPTEFTNVDIDEDGFVYTTNIDRDEGNRVKLLNAFGTDILKNYTGNEKKLIIGDYLVRDMSGFDWLSEFMSDSSTFADIAVRPKGMYSVIDTNKGRVFTYDQEGNLLYIFGGIGSQFGMFRNPISLDNIGDDILVLDSIRATVTVFEPTYYGNLINTAIGLRYDGNESEAVALWEEVLRIDNNYMLAHVGIGKANLSAGKNQEAMLRLRAGHDIKYYSVAYRRYRNEVLNDNLPVILTVILAAILVYYTVKITLGVVRKRKGKEVAHERA